MQKQLSVIFKKFLGYISLVGGIFFVWSLHPQFGLTLSSPQHTTISVTITTGALYGSIQPLDTNLVFHSGIYRTTTTTQPVTLSANLSSTYTLFGDIISSVTGSITPPSMLFSSPIIYLTPGDGIKNITTQIDSVILLSGGNITLPILKYGIDTTPPSLPGLIQGPNGGVNISDSFEFSRNLGYDGGSGIKEYVIQLSQNAHFPTAIEFISTGNLLQLSANSLETKQWFWRLGVVDNVGNILYSNAQSFYYNGSTGGGGTTSTANNPKPSYQTPISDQCNGPDLSKNFFDGLCTPLTTNPQLVNVPAIHQAPDERPFRDKMNERIENEPVKTYVFPAYDAPHAYTIYEYPVELVYKDIYEDEDREENSGTPIIVYNPRIGISKQVSPIIHQSSSAGKFVSYGIGDAYIYLCLWYQMMHNSCVGVLDYCPFEPMCIDMKIQCYSNEIVCKDLIY